MQFMIDPLAGCYSTPIMADCAATMVLRCN